MNNTRCPHDIARLAVFSPQWGQNSTLSPIAFPHSSHLVRVKVVLRVTAGRLPCGHLHRSGSDGALEVALVDEITNLRDAFALGTVEPAQLENPPGANRIDLAARVETLRTHDQQAVALDRRGHGPFRHFPAQDVKRH